MGLHGSGALNSGGFARALALLVVLLSRFRSIIPVKVSGRGTNFCGNWRLKPGLVQAEKDKGSVRLRKNDALIRSPVPYSGSATSRTRLLGTQILQGQEGCGHQATEPLLALWDTQVTLQAHSH